MNNTDIAVLSAKVEALFGVVDAMASAMLAQQDAAAPAKETKAKPEPKPAKVKTLTKAALDGLKAEGIVPRGTTRAQALAGVDYAGKPLSAEAKAVIATFRVPDGSMKQHFHDLKVAAAAAPEVAPKAPVSDEVDKAAILLRGGFTPEQVAQILSV